MRETILRVEVSEPTGGVVIVSCYGEVDVSVCEQLEAALSMALAAGQRLRVDMAELRFLDSSGLRCLIGARRHCDEAGIAFELVASPVVRRLIEALALGDYLRLAEAR